MLVDSRLQSGTSKHTAPHKSILDGAVKGHILQLYKYHRGDIITSMTYYNMMFCQYLK